MFALTASTLLLGLLGHQLASFIGLGSGAASRTGANGDRMARVAGYAVPMIVMVALGVEAVTSVGTPLIVGKV
jgi:hypothetical protein